MKKFLVALILLLGVLFVLARTAELNSILQVLQRGNVFFLLLALALSIGWLFVLSGLYRSIYQVFGITEKYNRMFLLTTSANFVNVVAPTGGLSGMVVFLSEARRVDRPRASVIISAVLFVWFEYLGTLTILVLGLAELAYRNDLTWSEIVASLVLLAGALGIALLLYLGSRSGDLLGRVLVFFSRVINRALRPVLRKPFLEERYALFFAREVAEGMRALQHNRRWAFRPFIFEMFSKGMLCLVLLCCFLAFRVPVSAGTLVAGMSIGHLFIIVSPTPAGIGFVEGAMALALRSLGTPMSDAAVVTIAYRSFTFWIPFFIGMVTVRRLQRGSRKPNNEALTPQFNALDE